VGGKGAVAERTRGFFYQMKKSNADTETLTIQLTQKDLARCRRAAAFCELSFDQWLKGSIISSMECDEDDMATDRGVEVGRNIPTGRDKCGWELREALPAPESFR